MPTEHRLTAPDAPAGTPEAEVLTGLYGKHPAFGDFIMAGLPDGAMHHLGEWMAQALGQWRDAMREDWQAHFDHMPAIRFWIGPLLFGGRPLRGVLAPSVDKSGRRFPLMIGQTAGLAPVLDPDQSFHDAALAALQGIAASSGFDPRETAQKLAKHLTPSTPLPETPAWPSFWAVNANLSPAELFADLVAADHANAVAGRSYWWFGGEHDQPSSMLACQGMPGPGDLGWLISGWRGIPLQQEAT